MTTTILDNPDDLALLNKLVSLTRQVAARDYRRIDELFDLTRQGCGCDAVRELAEAFGMMAVQVEGREFRLERLVEDLKTANLKLGEALQRVKASDAAKQKVIDHLSHELKTPLAIISGAFRRMADNMPRQSRCVLEKTIERGRRNVSRLVAVQEKVEDIVNNTASLSDYARHQRLVEGLFDLAEELSEEEAGAYEGFLDRLRAKIDSIHPVLPITHDTISMAHFLHETQDQALRSASSRDIRVMLEAEPDLFVRMDPVVLSKVFSGILKNAIENTPDGGSVEIRAAAENDEVVVTFRDDGVGISEEDQSNIFGGFFHTQDTDRYATKTPYQFDAGGTGSDLLRIKAFSQRFGFKLELGSRRCPHLARNSDQCPGATGRCRHIRSPAECGKSGGTEFRLRFVRCSGNAMDDGEGPWGHSPTGGG